MSVCRRCAATFDCAQADSASAAPCWCTALTPAVALPTTPDSTCWCPACLTQQLAALAATARKP